MGVTTTVSWGILFYAFSVSVMLGLDAIDGPVVGVVSGGNVEPAEYRRYLETPLPG